MPGMVMKEILLFLFKREKEAHRFLNREKDTLNGNRHKTRWGKAEIAGEAGPRFW
jgi:hypothetical protein